MAKVGAPLKEKLVEKLIHKHREAGRERGDGCRHAPLAAAGHAAGLIQVLPRDASRSRA